LLLEKYAHYHGGGQRALAVWDAAWEPSLEWVRRLRIVANDNALPPTCPDTESHHVEAASHAHDCMVLLVAILSILVQFLSGCLSAAAVRRSLHRSV